MSREWEVAFSIDYFVVPGLNLRVDGLLIIIGFTMNTRSTYLLVPGLKAVSHV